MKFKDIEPLAKRVIDEPWGLGLPHLSDAEASAPYYRFLHEMVKLYKPSLVVECGVYLGVATEHMALGNKDSYVIGIDIELTKRAIYMAKKYENIMLIHGDTVSSGDIVERYCEEHDSKIGLIFIDSAHDGYTARMEIESYIALFADECLVVCDDILDREMRMFWSWLPGEKHEMHYLHPSQYPGFPEPGFGISIMRH